MSIINFTEAVKHINAMTNNFIILSTVYPDFIEFQGFEKSCRILLHNYCSSGIGFDSVQLA